MYVHFSPAQNFLRDFPAGNRAICNILPRRETGILAQIIGKHFSADVVSRFSPGRNYSFFLGPLTLAPSSLLNRVPEKIKKFSTRWFVLLIPDIKNPCVWIGGKSVSDFLQTAELMIDALPYLLEGYLIAGDFHIHTTASDGKTKPEEVCYFAARSGLDAVAVTDHNSIGGAKEVRKHSPDGFPVLIGEEVSDQKGNHLLVFGVTESVAKGEPPERLIDKWRSSKLLLVQAHATDAIYFTVDKKRALGIEAFNFLSSAPQKGRDYAEEALERGCSIPVFGCSDAHLSEDIGKAKTYLLVSRFDSKAVLEAVRKGDAVAFYRGNFCGKEPLRKFLVNFYQHSNLLSGKLVPLSEMSQYGFPYLDFGGKKTGQMIKREKEIWYQMPLTFESGVVRVETTGTVEGYLDGDLVIFRNQGGVFPFSCHRGRPGKLSIRVTETKEVPISLIPADQWKVLEPEKKPPSKRIFCPTKHCQCREKWFRIDRYRFPFLLDFGSRMWGNVKLNSITDEFLFRPGMEVDLKPFLRAGKNEVSVFDEDVIKEFKPYVCLGKELKDWEIRLGKSGWRKVECASNLQVLGMVPVNYVGDVTYRTLLKRADFPRKNATLFFEGVDGEVDISVNGVCLMRRGAFHWEDAFEVQLDSLSGDSDSLELILHIKNEVGLCGLTNWVHLGETVYLKYPHTTIDIKKGQQGLQVLRCGEGRVRAFLCDSSTKVTRYWLAGVSSLPALVENYNNASWLVLNSFSNSFPSHQFRIASLITIGSKKPKIR